jgi:hypothetical protein
MTINSSIWAFWKVFIYPYWFSPFRHLARPKVAASYLRLYSLRLGLTRAGRTSIYLPCPSPLGKTLGGTVSEAYRGSPQRRYCPFSRPLQPRLARPIEPRFSGRGPGPQMLRLPETRPCAQVPQYYPR